MTCKLGGIDIIKAGMDRLSLEYIFRDGYFRDKHYRKLEFEFILVDELYDQRHAQVVELFKNVYYKFKHVRAEHYPYASLSINFNLGARNATGKYIIFLGDYVYPPANLLTRTWEIMEQYPLTILGYCNLAYDYPEIDLTDAEKNKISIFKNGFSSVQFAGKITRKDNILGYYQRRIAPNLHLVHKIDGFFCVAKKDLVFLNGYDEAIIKDEVNQDEDFLMRSQYNGLKFLCDPTLVVKRFRNQVYTFEKSVLTPGKTVPYLRTAEIYKQRYKKITGSVFERVDDFNGYEDRRGWNVVNIVMHPDRFKFADMLECHGYRVLALDQIAHYKVCQAVMFLKADKTYSPEAAIFMVTETGQIFSPEGEFVPVDELPQKIQQYYNKQVLIND